MKFKAADIPSNDTQRVKAVQRTGVLDENKTELYDIYCFLAKEITGCPVSWTGVIDNEKQFMLARDGFPDEAPMEMPRNQTLCQFAIEKTEPLIINDMTIDYRFKNHPAVVDFGVKFYAAFPVTTTDGYTLGTLCVSDNRVRRLTKNKIKLLKGNLLNEIEPERTENGFEFEYDNAKLTLDYMTLQQIGYNVEKLNT